MLAGDDDDLRRAAEEVRGFIGPTYARWAQPDDPTAADATEQEVNEFTAGRYLRFGTETEAEFEDVWIPLERLLRAWADRPQRGFTERRSIASLLRSIDLSLAGGDGAAALADLEELRSRGAISVENARFVEVLALGAQERWRDVIAHPDFDDLCRIRKPWRVTEALIRAAYDVWLLPAERALDVHGASGAYHRHRDVLADLLRVRGPLRSSEVVKAHALHLLAADAGRDRLSALRQLVEGPDAAWIDLLEGSVAGTAPSSAEPATALSTGEYDIALRAALDDVDHRFADVAILAAFEMNTLEAAQQALEHHRSLPPKQQEHVLERRIVREAVAALEQLVGQEGDPAPPSSWQAWLSRIMADPDWAAAGAIARCGELEFNAEDPIDDAALSTITGLVERAAESDARGVLLEGLPSLVAWLGRAPVPAASKIGVQIAVLQALALSSGWESAGLEVAGQLIAQVLEAGPSPEAYGALLDSIDLLWDQMASRRYAAWFADIMESLEFEPGDRDRLLASLTSGAGPLRSQRLPAEAREGLELTAAALGADFGLMPVIMSRLPRRKLSDRAQSLASTR